MRWCHLRSIEPTLTGTIMHYNAGLARAIFVKIFQLTPRRIVAQSSKPISSFLITRRVYIRNATNTKTHRPTAGITILREVRSLIGAPHSVLVTLSVANRSVRMQSACMYLVLTNWGPPWWCNWPRHNYSIPCWDPHLYRCMLGQWKNTLT
jgi:hypothetical protein